MSWMMASDAINKVIFDLALMGWDLMDDKGKAVPCDKEHKDIVLDIAYIADAISHAYLYMSRGARAQEKTDRLCPYGGRNQP